MTGVRPEALHECEVALATVTEDEARPDVDLAQVETLVKKPLDEITRRHAGEFGIEAHDEHQIDRAIG